MLYTVKCDQCIAVVINGRACHEQGCPNMHRPWTYIEPEEPTAPDAVGLCSPGDVETEDNYYLIGGDWF